ncbi:hypothetical protein PR048_013616 [Dryococelus australis]|uniref:PiggyBac transposable element-derived protein domain-containing protein n=1 Tax=Dryococelus australis TaxID=614101 RepID=A0ABQ9HSP6_9NEOP|nr:hypothetical protein PR048_013616 [Dryococelus australis]
MYWNQNNRVDMVANVMSRDRFNIALRLVECILENQNLMLFFDNWFSSLPLFTVLADMGIGALGTKEPTDFLGYKYRSFKSDDAAALCAQEKDPSEKKRSKPSSKNVQEWYERKKLRGPTKPIPEFNVRRDGVVDARQHCRRP